MTGDGVRLAVDQAWLLGANVALLVRRVAGPPATRETVLEARKPA